MSFARKFPLIVGSLLGSTIVLANFTDSDTVRIAILTGAFFAQGLSATSWAAMSEVAPKGLIGATAGLTSVGANLAGIVTPVVIGYIVRETGLFAWGAWLYQHPVVDWHLFLCVSDGHGIAYCPRLPFRSGLVSIASFGLLESGKPN